jgi:hypothetical protein
MRRDKGLNAMDPIGKMTSLPVAFSHQQPFILSITFADDLLCFLLSCPLPLP